MSDLTDEIREQVFKEARERTRANAMKRGEIRLRMISEHIDSFYELWYSWVRVFGPREAADNLMEAMVRQHEVIRARLQYKAGEKKRDQATNPSGGNGPDHPVR
jgi:hypothetical protein